MVEQQPLWADGCVYFGFAFVFAFATFLRVRFAAYTHLRVVFARACALCTLHARMRTCVLRCWAVRCCCRARTRFPVLPACLAWRCHTLPAAAHCMQTTFTLLCHTCSLHDFCRFVFPVLLLLPVPCVPCTQNSCGEHLPACIPAFYTHLFAFLPACCHAHMHITTPFPFLFFCYHYHTNTCAWLPVHVDAQHCCDFYLLFFYWDTSGIISFSFSLSIFVCISPQNNSLSFHPHMNLIRDNQGHMLFRLSSFHFVFHMSSFLFQLLFPLRA